MMSFGNYGYHIRPDVWKEKIDRSHPFIQNVHSRFRISKYNQVSKPLVIGKVHDTRKFSFAKNELSGLSVFNCPIKVPGSNEYSIPKELDQFTETIKTIISFEHAINPFTIQYFAHLTIRQARVERNQFHGTFGACFTNGLPLINAKYNRPVARSYSIYDRVPDKFYCQSFNIKEPTVMEFSSQLDESTAVCYDPYSIVAHDVYTICKETTVDFPFYRTFFRLMFNTEKRIGFDRNPMVEN